jgi:hypothetical protein
MTGWTPPFYNRMWKVPESVMKAQWHESASELHRPSYRRLSAKLVPTFADRGCQVVSATDPFSRILGFLDLESVLRRCSFPIIMQLFFGRLHFPYYYFSKVISLCLVYTKFNINKWNWISKVFSRTFFFFICLSLIYVEDTVNVPKIVGFMHNVTHLFTKTTFPLSLLIALQVRSFLHLSDMESNWYSVREDKLWNKNKKVGAALATPSSLLHCGQVHLVFAR